MLHDRRTSLILLAATSLLGSALLSGCGAMADTWERGLPMPGFSVTGGTAGEDPGKDYVPSMEVDPAKLVGGWEEPVPGQPGRFQGYRLNKDGTASSINMATLAVNRWSVKGDILTLYGDSIGNGITIPFAMEYLIEEVTPNTLKIRQGSLEHKFEKVL